MMELPRPGKNREKGWLRSLERLLPQQKQLRFLIKYVAVPLVSLLLVYLLFDFAVMPIITRHGAEFPLPDITEKREEAARAILRDSDLDLEVTAQEYRPGKPEGIVLSQYPPAGTQVKSGRIVKVTVSSGVKMVTIPPLGGFSVRQAKLNIEAVGLVLGEIAWTFSDSLPESVVVFSYPASGTEILAGSAVNLMVNRGRLAAGLLMPQLVGKTLDEAKQLIEDSGLKVGLVRYVRNKRYLPETVLEQSAPEGAQMDPGEEIDLVVSMTD